MKDKVITFKSSNTMFYARFEKKHWWNKWKLYAIGNGNNVLSKYNKRVKIAEYSV